MQGQKVMLRVISKEDVPFVNKLRNDWANKKMTLGVRFPISLEDDYNWYNKVTNDHSNKNVYFIIKNIHEKNIGLIQLSTIDWINRNAYIGIQVVREEWGKGIASESIGLMLDYSFNVLNLNKIIAEVASFNEISLRLFEKCDFEIEGQLKKQLYYDNCYHDIFILSKFKQ